MASSQFGALFWTIWHPQHTPEEEVERVHDNIYLSVNISTVLKKKKFLKYIVTICTFYEALTAIHSKINLTLLHLSETFLETTDHTAAVTRDFVAVGCM